VVAAVLAAMASAATAMNLDGFFIGRKDGAKKVGIAFWLLVEKTSGRGPRIGPRYPMEVRYNCPTVNNKPHIKTHKLRQKSAFYVSTRLRIDLPRNCAQNTATS
jgi:hypothetical protein